MHDLLGVAVFLMIFSAIIFFAPEMGGYFLEYNNFIPADPLKTPAHIAPVWYFTPYYSMLRATTDPMVNVLCVHRRRRRVAGRAARAGCQDEDRVAVVGAVVLIGLLKTFDAKFWGVVVMGAAVIILFFLPWLDHSPVKSIRYRPGWHKCAVRRVRRRTSSCSATWASSRRPTSARWWRRSARCSTSASSC